MILVAEIPLPPHWHVGPETALGVLEDAPVTDPASGVVGRVTSAHVVWGRPNRLRLQVDVNDADAVIAATRDGGVF